MTSTNNLRTLAAELDEARQDVALLERLKAAPDRLKRLTAEHAKAQAAYDNAKAADEAAAEEARFKGLLDISVRDTTPEESVLRTCFKIAYTRMAYDGEQRASLPSQQTVTGFDGLPNDVFAYLLLKHPSHIPAKVMALAPGDAHAAFARYFMGLKRGFLAG